MAGDAAAPLPPAGFEVVRRGYDQEQVEAHLRRLDAEMRILATDRDAAVDQSAQLTRELDDSRARAERLRAQVRTLVSPQQSVQGMSERMRSMLRMAEDEVAEMLQRADNEVTKSLHDAEQKAAGIVEDARAEADAIRMQSKADAEAAEEQDTRRRAELEAAESAHHERLAATPGDGRARDRRGARPPGRRAAGARRGRHRRRCRGRAQRRSDAWTESETRRRQVEADFRIAMDQRRKEALTALTAEQLATRAATEEMRERAHAERSAHGRGRAGGGGADRGRRRRRRGAAARAAAAHGRAARGARGPTSTPSSPRSARCRASRHASSRPRRPSGSPVVQPSPAFHADGRHPRRSRHRSARRIRHARADSGHACRPRTAAGAGGRRRPAAAPGGLSAFRLPPGRSLRRPGAAARPARRVPVPPVGDRAWSAAGHATTCGVPAGTTWSQPGQR